MSGVKRWSTTVYKSENCTLLLYVGCEKGGLPMCMCEKCGLFSITVYK